MTHAEECKALRAEVARTAALVGADGDEVVSGLQAEIELKAVALETLQTECSKLEAEAVVLIEANDAAAATKRAGSAAVDRLEAECSKLEAATVALSDAKDAAE